MNKTPEQQICEDALERMKLAVQCKDIKGKTEMPDWMRDLFSMGKEGKR